MREERREILSGKICRFARRNIVLVVKEFLKIKIISILSAQVTSN